MKQYEIPEPNEKPMEALVIIYKLVKQIEYDDRVWDGQHFARGMRCAKKMLEIFGAYEIAKRCIEEIARSFEEKGISWNFETILKHAHDWKTKQRGSHDRKVRQRFLDDLARQRANKSLEKKGSLVTGGEIFSPLGNLEVFQSGIGSEESGRNNGDGGVGEPIREDSLETKKVGGLG